VIAYARLQAPKLAQQDGGTRRDERFGTIARVEDELRRPGAIPPLLLAQVGNLTRHGTARVSNRAMTVDGPKSSSPQNTSLMIFTSFL
jgi:hypothetical protein